MKMSNINECFNRFMPISITLGNLNEEDIDLLIEEIVNEENFENQNLS